MENLTENGSLWNSNLQDQCFLFEMVESPQGFMYPIHIVTALLNGIFAVVTTMGNSLVIYVIWKNISLHTPSNVLLCCLAFSDLAVGLLAQPAFVAHKIGKLIHNFRLYCLTRVTLETVGQICAGVSTLTLAAISVERYLALRFSLRYNVIVTNMRVFMVVGLFWVVFTVSTISKLFVEKINSLHSFFLFSVTLSSFGVISVSCVFVFRCVVRHQKRINSEQIPGSIEQQDFTSKRSSFSLLRYKKATLTMAYVLGIYLLFYLPFIGVMIARKFYGYTQITKAAYVCTSTLIFLNSSANPLIYCWRIKEIRIPVKIILKKLFSSHTPVTNFEPTSNGVGAINLSRNYVYYVQDQSETRN
ncbi:adenosine receptor A3-like [Actinia tenebrosa]|uniref:Adenosine receptor A3-like n=1 Tax=Actinia tenebrosa TaxID=6105 RepID=A0A6P8IYZ1_ACTTE|nr:adenosine receptor A3-like [Actinia tenebrosa]